VVDDKSLVRDVFELAIDEHDYKILAACDGVEGVELVKRDNPHLVFLTLKKLKMNDIEALLHIKQTLHQCQCIL